MLDEMIDVKSTTTATQTQTAATSKAATGDQSDYLDMLDDMLNGIASPSKSASTSKAPSTPPQAVSKSSLADVDVSLDELLSSMGLDEPKKPEQPSEPKSAVPPSMTTSGEVSHKRSASVDSFSELEATISDLEAELTDSGSVPPPKSASPAPAPSAQAIPRSGSALDLLEQEIAGLETAPKKGMA